jgi:hypothetical protein
MWFMCIVDSALCGKSCVEEEGGLPLRVSSTLCCSAFFCWKLCERHRQTIAGDINESEWLKDCVQEEEHCLSPSFIMCCGQV